MTARWSASGRRCRGCSVIAAFGSPVLDSRMKYGLVLSGPLVVTVHVLTLRWNSSAVAR